MKMTVREITETAMLIAIAIILDQPLLKFKVGANGGSISLTMIPLFILALRVGPLKSFISIGIVYSFLSCVSDGEPFYSLPFDYALGYGSIALAGLFNKQIMTNKPTIKGAVFMLISVVVACIGRLISSSISSVIFYGVTFIQGIIYNALYIGPACMVVGVVLLLLYNPIVKINNAHPIKSIW